MLEDDQITDKIAGDRRSRDKEGELVCSSRRGEGKARERIREDADSQVQKEKAEVDRR